MEKKPKSLGKFLVPSFSSYVLWEQFLMRMNFAVCLEHFIV